MIIAGFLLAIVGGAVFTLPSWLPQVADVTAQPEAFAVAGQIGGALIGAGLALVVLSLFRRRR